MELYNKIHQERFNHQIELFEKYINDVLDQFEKNATSFSAGIPQLNEEGRLIEIEYWNNASNFPNLLKKSTLITLNSFLESTLKEIMERSKTKDNLKKQGQESNILMYIRLIKTKYIINNISDNESALLEKIDINNTLRNIIVHDNGNIEALNDTEKNKVRSLIAKLEPQLLLTNSQDIIIYDRQYLILYAETIQKYCNKIFDAIIKKDILQ